MRYFIELAYKGTDFHGWQKQPNANSIQSELQTALNIILRKPIEIVGAGRTDTGVHATQIYAHFDCHKSFNKKDLAYKLNAILPKTIVIKKLLKVIDEAHARFDAMYRSYEYHIEQQYNPFTLDTTWQIPNKEFDIHKMNQAALILHNHINFKAFSKSKTDVKTYDCTITEAKWITENNKLIFHITANRFLRNMVRAIVGTLLEVGEGKISIDDFEKIILSQNRENAGLSVPARGLFLTKVSYPNKIFIN